MFVKEIYQSEKFSEQAINLKFYDQVFRFNKTNINQ